MNVLFICSQNMLRSPTAEAVFQNYDRLECRSAGTEFDAEIPVSEALIRWAEIIFVMETFHEKRLAAIFGPLLKDKRLIVLHIRDDYERMDPELIKILEERVPPYLTLPTT